MPAEAGIHLSNNRGGWRVGPGLRACEGFPDFGWCV